MAEELLYDNEPPRWPAPLWRRWLAGLLGNHCRCYQYDGGPYGGSAGDHFCSKLCPHHGPCGRCG